MLGQLYAAAQAKDIRGQKIGRNFWNLSAAWKQERRIHLRQPEAQRKSWEIQRGNLKWGIADMASRRMFSLDIVNTDPFLDMPVSAQAFYFHLGMRADDDDFVSSPKRITNMVGCNTDDLKLLIAKGFRNCPKITFNIACLYFQ